MRKLVACAALAGFVLLAAFVVHAQDNTMLIRAVDWNLKGDLIAFARNDGTVQVLNAATLEEVHTFQINAPATTIAFKPDICEHKLATGGLDGIVQVWNTTTGLLEDSFTGHTGMISGLAWSTANPNLLASTSYGGRLIVWDTATGLTVFSVISPREIYDVAWASDGNHLASAEGSRIVVRNASTGAEMTTLDGVGGQVISVSWSSDTSTIVGATIVGEMLTWNATSAMIEANFIGSFNETLDGITATSFSPDGSKLASSGIDGVIRIWDATTAQIMTTIEADAPIFDVQWSPDGHAIVYGGDNSLVKVADLTSLLPTPTETATATDQWYNPPCTFPRSDL